MDLGVGGGRGGKGRPGRQLSCAIKVQFNGNLLVGKATTAQLALARKQIKFIPLGTAEEERAAGHSASGSFIVMQRPWQRFDRHNRFWLQHSTGHACDTSADPPF
jgi:hypothetical protein